MDGDTNISILDVCLYSGWNAHIYPLVQSARGPGSNETSVAPTTQSTDLGI